MRRSSRAVCSNLAEAWRKRRYAAAFVSKLSDSEAAETQTWLRFAQDCGYLPADTAQELHATYDLIIGKLLRSLAPPAPLLLRSSTPLSFRNFPCIQPAYTPPLTYTPFPL